MKCLWLMRKYPRPVNSGELIYSDGLVRSVAAAGVELTVIAHDNDEKPVGSLGKHSIYRDEQEIEWRLGSPNLCGRMQSLLSKYPADAYRLKSDGPEEALRDAMLNEAWDAVIIDHAAIGWAADVIASCSSKLGTKPLLVYISHNHEAKIRPEIARNSTEGFPKAAALRWDAQKYAKLENNLMEVCDLVSAITETEVQAYQENFPDQSYLCLSPGYDGPRFPDREITEATPRRAVMSGSFEWIAKQYNLELFLDRTAQAFADAKIELQIVGKAPDDFRESISQRFPSVSMVGRVPEMSPYLTDARVGLVIEEHGGGFKLKQLEYIFHGLPLVGLDKAIDGLPLSSPEQLILAQDFDGLVKEVADCIDDLPRLNQIRRDAYRICEASFNWADRGRDLVARLETMTDNVALAY